MGGKSIVVAGFPGVGKSILTSKGGVLEDVEFVDSKFPKLQCNFKAGLSHWVIPKS